MEIESPKYISLDAALGDREVPDDVRSTLALVAVPYLSFDGSLHEGQLIVHKELASEVCDLFTSLIEMSFPIEKIVPLPAYGWDDEASMIDNNTSAFNYRPILETNRLSNHSFGRAIDINPVQNPYRSYSGKVYPPNATHDLTIPGTITDEVVTLFKNNGWEWGGDWTGVVDFQHFQKL